MVSSAAPPSAVERANDQARGGGARAGRATWRPSWRTLRLAAAGLLVMLVLSGGMLPRELRIRQTANPYAFHLVDWLLGRIGERAGRIGVGMLGQLGPVDAGDRALASAYFAASGAEREQRRAGAEGAIERALTTVLVDAGFGAEAPWLDGGRIVFPPASFTFVSPPNVLVVSPRDRIATAQAELLRPGLSDDEARALESAVDGGEVVSLVVETGGLATYPAMVVRGSRPADALAAVAHEWSHGYLFFSPLGVRYWASNEARAINETAAELVGQELGASLERELGLDVPTPPRAQGTGRRDRESRTLLRATRVEVDRLLSAGEVERAEALMRERRDELAALGLEIRKLNQAYFAFYGSYGDAAAGASPVPAQLRRLRSSCANVAEFLRRVGDLTSSADLARAVGDPTR